MQGLPSNSIIQEYECKILFYIFEIVKPNKAKNLGIYTERCYERHFITLLKSVKHLWFMYFNAWGYITPGRYKI